MTSAWQKKRWRWRRFENPKTRNRMRWVFFVRPSWRRSSISLSSCVSAFFSSASACKIWRNETAWKRELWSDRKAMTKQWFVTAHDLTWGVSRSWKRFVRNCRWCVGVRLADGALMDVDTLVMTIHRSWEIVTENAKMAIMSHLMTRCTGCTRLTCVTRVLLTGFVSRRMRSVLGRICLGRLRHTFDLFARPGPKSPKWPRETPCPTVEGGRLNTFPVFRGVSQSVFGSLARPEPQLHGASGKGR